MLRHIWASLIGLLVGRYAFRNTRTMVLEPNGMHEQVVDNISNISFGSLLADFEDPTFVPSSFLQTPPAANEQPCKDNSFLPDPIQNLVEVAETGVGQCHMGRRIARGGYGDVYLYAGKGGNLVAVKVTMHFGKGEFIRDEGRRAIMDYYTGEDFQKDMKRNKGGDINDEHAKIKAAILTRKGLIASIENESKEISTDDEVAKFAIAINFAVKKLGDEQARADKNAGKGLYTIVSPISVREKMSTNSTALGGFGKGTLVHVEQVASVQEGNLTVVRGKITSPSGWINLQSATEVQQNTLRKAVDAKYLEIHRVGPKVMRRSARNKGNKEGNHVMKLLAEPVEWKGRMWTIMPFMNKGDLRENILSRQWSRPLLFGLWYQAELAIREIHNDGISHMDLKELNVLVNCNHENPWKNPHAFQARVTDLDLAVISPDHRTHKIDKPPEGCDVTPAQSEEDSWENSPCGLAIKKELQGFKESEQNIPFFGKLKRTNFYIKVLNNKMFAFGKPDYLKVFTTSKEYPIYYVWFQRQPDYRYPGSSLGYTGPEAILGNRADREFNLPSTDFWALGVMLYRIAFPWPVDPVFMRKGLEEEAKERKKEIYKAIKAYQSESDIDLKRIEPESLRVMVRNLLTTNPEKRWDTGIIYRESKKVMSEMVEYEWNYLLDVDENREIHDKYVDEIVKKQEKLKNVSAQDLRNFGVPIDTVDAAIAEYGAESLWMWVFKMQEREEKKKLELLFKIAMTLWGANSGDQAKVEKKGDQAIVDAYRQFDAQFIRKKIDEKMKFIKEKLGFKVDEKLPETDPNYKKYMKMVTRRQQTNELED